MWHSIVPDILFNGRYMTNAVLSTCNMTCYPLSLPEIKVFVMKATDKTHTKLDTGSRVYKVAWALICLLSSMSEIT